jgi:homoserine O-acetyltransferase
MGALQAFEWATSEPEGVARIAAVCGASRCGELNRVFLRSLEAALHADAAWDERAQRFTHRPERGLRAFATIYAGWGVGPDYYRTRAYAAAGYASADDFVQRSYLPAFAGCDADDLLAQVRTWREADATRGAPSLEAALGAVRARVLLMPCDSDGYFTLVEAECEAAALGGRAIFKPIRSASGHRAGDPHRPELKAEYEFIRQAVHDLLAGDA